MNTREWVDAFLRAMDILVAWPVAVTVLAVVFQRSIRSGGVALRSWFERWMENRGLEATTNGVRTIPQYINIPAVESQSIQQGDTRPRTPEVDARTDRARLFADNAETLLRTVIERDRTTRNARFFELRGAQGINGEIALRRPGDKALAFTILGLPVAAESPVPDLATVSQAGVILRERGIATSDPPFSEPDLRLLMQSHAIGPLQESR